MTNLFFGMNECLNEESSGELCSHFNDFLGVIKGLRYTATNLPHEPITGNTRIYLSFTEESLLSSFFLFNKMENMITLNDSYKPSNK